MIKTVLTLLIKFYRKYISVLKPPCCRFYPTCSQYALEAVDKHGALMGTYLAVMRILRCHPFNKGGYDPVPEQSLLVFSEPLARLSRLFLRNL